MPAGEPAQVWLARDEAGSDAVIKRARALRKQLKRAGPKPVQTYELVLAGPPRYDDGAWTLDRETQWAKDCFDWFRSAFPTAHVLRARADRDESAPHPHFEFHPTLANGEISWRRLLAEVTERIAGKPILGRGREYRKQQSSLYETVNRHYQLGRGKLASETGRKHTDIDRNKSTAATDQAQNRVLNDLYRGLYFVLKRDETRSEEDIEEIRAHSIRLWRDCLKTNQDHTPDRAQDRAAPRRARASDDLGR